MAFFEERFSPALSFGARGGPVFSTSKAFTVGGFRSANKNWASPLHRYDVSPAVRSQADLDEVTDFFYVVAGSFDGFRWKDWRDFLDAGRGVMTLTTGSTYQMFKTYTKGARTFHRKITKPVAGVQVIRVRSGVETDITGTCSIDLTTGLVTVNTGHAAGDVYRWVGEFDVPVEFMSDELMPSIVDKGPDGFLVEVGQILLQEIRL